MQQFTDFPGIEQFDNYWGEPVYSGRIARVYTQAELSEVSDVPPIEAGQVLQVELAAPDNFVGDLAGMIQRIKTERLAGAELTFWGIHRLGLGRRRLYLQFRVLEDSAVAADWRELYSYASYSQTAQTAAIPAGIGKRILTWILGVVALISATFAGWVIHRILVIVEEEKIQQSVSDVADMAKDLRWLGLMGLAGYLAYIGYQLLLRR